MKLLRRLLKKKPEFTIKLDHKYEKAFNDGVEDYFMFVDSFNLPSTRALCAIDFYRELEMGCDKNYLKAHVATLKDIARGNKSPDKLLIGRMALQMEERIDFVKSADLFLKLASVLYWDKTENPYVYDHAYGLKKMERWRKDEKMLDFFLQSHIGSLLPYLKESGISSKTYFQTTGKITAMHSETLSSRSSSPGSKTDNANS